MQWLVIAVLIIGGAIGGYLMYHKLSDLQDTNTTLQGERDDLRNQLNQAQAAASASPSPSPSPSPTATPSPTHTPLPVTTHTPTPVPKR